jgi:hypothetical protein
MRPHKAFGVDFEASEIITSNDQFLTDGSGSFRNLDNALRHFDKLSNRFVRQDYVVPKLGYESELILECQTL